MVFTEMNNFSRNRIVPFVAAICLSGLADTACAVEGGLPAYLLGSRESLAGIMPPAGTYVGLDLVTFSGDVTGLSLAGLPIRAKSNLDVDLIKFSVTYVFEASLWGGTPAININIPYVSDATLSFIGELPPIEGAAVRDSTSGIGDIVITSFVGWHKDKLHYNAGVSVFAPTGDYEVAKVSLAPYNVDAVNTGKNVWSVQPEFSMTYLNTDNGRELSGAATLLFSEKNSATDYATAPALTVESAFMQHLPNGWAIGATAYWYEQLGDDSGTGAVKTRAALLTSSLRASAFGAGPLVTYNGELFGQTVSFRAKYISEFGAKRRFENDTFWLNATLGF